MLIEDAGDISTVPNKPPFKTEKELYVYRISGMFKKLIEKNSQLCNNEYKIGSVLAKANWWDRFMVLTDFSRRAESIKILTEKNGKDFNRITEGLSSFDKDSLKRLDDKLTETLDSMGIDYTPLRQDTLNQELLQNNAGNVSRGHLIETVDTENDTISSNSKDKYWLLTDDGSLEFHGGGSLRNSHGEIMHTYCSNTPIGSPGIETGLMKIFNYASHEGAGNNGRSVSNYKGPFDRDNIIEKMLDAGLNYYTTDDTNLDDRKDWSWSLQENLVNNTDRRIKLSEEVLAFYKQFEPGWKRVEGGFIGADYTKEGGDAKYHVGVDWVWRSNNQNKTIGVEVLSTTDGKVLEKGKNSSLGNFIRIECSDGARIDYFHLDSVVSSLQKKSSVVAGTTLMGYAGDTGIGAAHLHIAKSYGEKKDVVDNDYAKKEGDGIKLDQKQYIQYTGKDGTTGRYYVTPSNPITPPN